MPTLPPNPFFLPPDWGRRNVTLSDKSIHANPTSSDRSRQAGHLLAMSRCTSVHSRCGAGCAGRTASGGCSAGRSCAGGGGGHDHCCDTAGTSVVVTVAGIVIIVVVVVVIVIVIVVIIHGRAWACHSGGRDSGRDGNRGRGQSGSNAVVVIVVVVIVVIVVVLGYGRCGEQGNEEVRPEKHLK